MIYQRKETLNDLRGILVGAMIEGISEVESDGEALFKLTLLCATGARAEVVLYATELGWWFSKENK